MNSNSHVLHSDSRILQVVKGPYSEQPIPTVAIYRINTMSTPILNILSVVLIFCCVGCQTGPYPARLSSKEDIKRTNPQVRQIWILNELPLEDHRLLSKFRPVRAVKLWSRDGQHPTDAKLKELAEVSLTNLVDVNLLNGRLVTDEGIRALAKIPSIRFLGVEGTAITDSACEVMASQMRLTHVNVANCSGVTLKGIKALAASPSVTNLSFSANNVTQEQVLDLIGSFKNITWCSVVDTEGKLDDNAIRAKGAERNIYAFVSSTGALQSMGWDR